MNAGQCLLLRSAAVSYSNVWSSIYIFITMYYYVYLQCTSNICMRSGVGAITRSLYCVGHDQLFPYHMCNASDTPANQKECPREDCYATWSATTWSEVSEDMSRLT